VTKGGSSWPNDALQQIPASFDSVDVHNYNSDITSYTEQVHAWMNATGHGTYPLWLSEWATYRGGYDSVGTGVKLVLNNLIRGSRPGNDYVYGSHLFTFYDWDGFSGGFQNFQGLVDINGARRASFYALRMGTRALNGCKMTYQTLTNNGNLLAITTKDAAGHIDLLVTNSTANTSYTVDADLSALITSGTGTMWRFDSTHLDVITDSPVVTNGHVLFTVPGTAAVLIEY
jgi:hypothetical protein